MHAGKPDLNKSLVVGRVGRCGWGWFLLFGPQHRMEGRSLVIKRHCVAREPHSLVEHAIRELQRPNPVTDAARHFIYWQPVGRNGVPQSHEFDGRHVDVLIAIVSYAPTDEI